MSDNEERNLTVRDSGALQPMSVSDVMAQVQSIQQLMERGMKEGEHYGKIPGCGDKPALLQSGAEKLSLMFGLRPAFERTRTDLSGGHREYEVTCTLKTRNGDFFGQGMATATTMERKYRFRTGPSKDTGKEVPSDYWKDRDPKFLGGAGFQARKNKDGKWTIHEQGGQVEHDNPADYYNTVLKMACKRALVAAVKTTLATSDIFTQDIDDDPELYGGKVIDAEIVEPQKPKKEESTVEPAPKKTKGIPDDVRGDVWKELVEYAKASGRDKGEALKEFSMWGDKYKTIKDIPDLTDKRAGVILSKIRAAMKALEEPEVAEPESDDPFGD